MFSDARLTRLIAYMRQLGPCALAFSGGVDSSLAAYAARQALGGAMLAVTVRSEFVSAHERQRAGRMAAHLDVPQVLAEFSALADASLRSNPTLRCYLCKVRVLEAVRQAGQGYFPMGTAFVLVEGTNADDDPTRPGRQAVAEAGAHSPLAACGLTKADVRELARGLGLPNADDPSNSCLATRIPQGRELTYKRLVAVEAMEHFARGMGLTDVRARVLPHERRGYPDAVRMDIRPEQLLLALSVEAHLRERAEFIGFTSFTWGER